jgi:protein-disulfide isomerase
MKKLPQKFPALLMAWVVLSAFALQSFTGLAASVQEKAELKKNLRELLREDPEIIFELLRDNSELVLDIAQLGADLRQRRAYTARWAAELKEAKTAKLEGRPSKGPANAPVTIVAFTDFTCMYCQQAEETVERLVQAYGEKVRVVYKSLPMQGNPGSVESAEFMLAAYMQDKAKAWALFDDLFANRMKIIAKDGDAYLRSAAISHGLNMQKLIADAKSEKVKNLIREDAEDAKTLQAKGTPFFLVNNLTINGSLQENLFRQAVDMALAEAEKKPK